MKSLFHIQSGETRSEAEVLLIEIGTDYFSYAVFNKGNNSIAALHYFTVDEFELEFGLSSLLHSTELEPFSEVWICSAYPNALLIPSGYNGQNQELLDLIYDQPLQYFFQDHINEWQMVNAHAMPLGVAQILKQRFPSAQFLHFYTPALKIYNGFASDNQISVHFSTQFFRVLVKRGAMVELAQIYSYKTPLDVVYYLLKICAELQLSQAETAIILSGLIEEASALYKELHNYFLNIHFANQPSVTLPGHEYPQHFFTATYNLAACVS